MSFSDVDKLAINTIRVLAVSYNPSPQQNIPAPAAVGRAIYPTIGRDRAENDMRSCLDTITAKGEECTITNRCLLSRSMPHSMPTPGTPVRPCKSPDSTQLPPAPGLR